MTIDLLGAVAFAIVSSLLAAAIAVLMLRHRAAPRTAEAAEQLGELARLQSETAVRLDAMADMLARRQVELQRAVNERLDAVSHRVGQSMQSTTQQTTENLQKLNERLAVIDTAQRNLTDLAAQVTSLRAVLTDKQSRGAFGQGRMEAIVQDGLPKGAFAFQVTLSNGKRPDCIIRLPDGRPLVIDAKFPLEAITAHKAATSDDQRKLAGQRLRQDVSRHVDDIAERYLIPGETQDIALMFVPSESVYAELYDGFDDVVQKAFRARVVLVSPSLLMLAIQMIQHIHKDARMRDAVDQVRDEVGHLIEDVGRLRDRVLKLQQHFTQSSEDIRLILVSSEKIDKRGSRISELDFADQEPPPQSAVVIPGPMGRKLEAGE